MASEVAQTPSVPPHHSTGIWQWLRANLFNSWLNSIITLALLWLIVQVLFTTVEWIVTTQGWQAVIANLRLFFVGRYPAVLVWRIELGVWIVALLLGLSGGIWRGTMQVIALSFGTLMAALIVVPLALPPAEAPTLLPPLFFLIGAVALTGLGYLIGKQFSRVLPLPVVILWLLSFPFIMLVLVRGVGDVGPLETVPTNLWGGLLVTMALAVVGIVASFPLGVFLALGRRSDLPVVKVFCTLYIELVRGVPLITVLYMMSLMLPLFLPAGWRVDQLIRAMVAVTLFSAAYLAENVRGGLQSIPRGQYEAAHALGLNYWQTTMLITLPQALRAVIPALVGQFISLFKDTSLVVIVGLFDLLGIAQVVMTQTEWLGTPGGVWRETLFFIAVVYFIFTFMMSRVSLRIEENLGVGRR